MRHTYGIITRHFSAGKLLNCFWVALIIQSPGGMTVLLVCYSGGNPNPQKQYRYDMKVWICI